MRRFAAAALLAAIAGCGPTMRAGAPQRPTPGASVPAVFDAGSVYRSMGFLVGGPPLPFVATVQYLADAAPDSTLAVFALSLSNHALSFQRDGNEFLAQYHVEIAFRGDTANTRQVATDETVRVRTFQETLRTDESVIYERFVAVPPGVYRVVVTVRDRNGPAVAHQERVDTVPRFAGSGLSAPLAVYEVTPRTRRAEAPKLLVNPRATLAYGSDSLRFYVEAYGMRRGARVAVRVLDQTDQPTWQDTLAIAGNDTLAPLVIALRSVQLSVGRGRFEVVPVGAGFAAGRGAPFLVSLSDQWAITNYDQMISLLRYFERQDWVDSLRKAASGDRAALWRRFYKATDPVPITPENEALDQYFRRVQLANLRYQEGGDPGWLTDRGEVFITLGEPDDVFDFSADLTRSGVRGMRWTYNELRVTLFFQDQGGFGRFRLTPTSRAEYQRALDRVRRRL
ncbi:MAG TPA: GWxTD domain-containing protein [Gemmatimonadales bacterium]|nr:GWxTD domain-containing protein [Gemmatimonadales bacterium]